MKDALQAALVQNQAGDMLLKKIWGPMVEKGRHSWLRGDEIVGYEGILVYHRTVKKDLDKIFWALTTISHRWEGTADDQLAFRRMVSEVPRLASDDTTKALLACSKMWSDWARLILPTASERSTGRAMEVGIRPGK